MKTTTAISITLPNGVKEAADAQLDQGFGVPKGAYSALITSLMQAWLVERTGELPPTALDQALTEEQVDE